MAYNVVQNGAEEKTEKTRKKMVKPKKHRPTSPRSPRNPKAGKFKWTIGLEEKFIDYMEELRYFYDRSEDDYNNIIKKRRARDDFAAKYNIPVEELVSKWQGYRTQFQKHIKELPSGSGAPPKLSKRKKWLFGRLEFLRKHSKGRETTSNLAVRKESGPSRPHTRSAQKMVVKLGRTRAGDAAQADDDEASYADSESAAGYASGDDDDEEEEKEEEEEDDDDEDGGEEGVVSNSQEVDSDREHQISDADFPEESTTKADGKTIKNLPEDPLASSQSQQTSHEEASQSVTDSQEGKEADDKSDVPIVKEDIPAEDLGVVVKITPVVAEESPIQGNNEEATTETDQFTRPENPIEKVEEQLDEFGDTSKPKLKSSSKTPAKSSKKKKKKVPASPRSPTPPATPVVVVQDDEDSPPPALPPKKKRLKRSGEEAAQFLDELRKTLQDASPKIGNDEPKKKVKDSSGGKPTKSSSSSKTKKVGKYAEDYDDADGAGGSGHQQPTTTESSRPPSRISNPLSVTASRRNSAASLKSLSSTGSGGKKKGKKSESKPIEEQKLDVMKNLAEVYQTKSGMPNIFISPFPMAAESSADKEPKMSETRKADDATELDDLEMWGKITIRKLRRIEDDDLREDVQDYIHQVIKATIRGEWRPPKNFHVAGPEMPQTPPAPTTITHTIRSSPLVPMPTGRTTTSKRKDSLASSTGKDDEKTSVGASSRRFSLAGQDLAPMNNPNQATFIGNTSSGLADPTMSQHQAQTTPEFQYTWAAQGLHSGAHHNPTFYLNYPGYQTQSSGQQQQQQQLQPAQHMLSIQMPDMSGQMETERNYTSM